MKDKYSLDKYFLDTNILIYSFDHQAENKKSIAQSLIENALINKNGVISFQVVQEFINVATKKFLTPLSEQDSIIYLNQVLSPLCHLYPNASFYSQAILNKERWRYSWYDSIIITAALNLNCKILYSEDMQHLQKFDGLTIVNPFK